jgi:hypothetical protein
MPNQMTTAMANSRSRHETFERLSHQPKKARNAMKYAIMRDTNRVCADNSIAWFAYRDAQKATTKTIAGQTRSVWMPVGLDVGARKSCESVAVTVLM